MRIVVNDEDCWCCNWCVYYWELLSFTYGAHYQLKRTFPKQTVKIYQARQGSSPQDGHWIKNMKARASKSIFKIPLYCKILYSFYTCLNIKIKVNLIAGTAQKKPPVSSILQQVVWMRILFWIFLMRKQSNIFWEYYLINKDFNIL